MKDPIKVKKGKKSRIAGKDFELRVRKDLESKGWVCDKWTNNVELPKRELNSEEDYEEYPVNELYGKLIPAKAKFNPFTKSIMMNSGGFPDFICFKFIKKNDYPYEDMSYMVIGVESKMDGKLNKEEKEKCVWILKNKIFSRILIASKIKIKNKIHVHYEEFI